MIKTEATELLRCVRTYFEKYFANFESKAREIVKVSRNLSCASSQLCASVEINMEKEFSIDFFTCGIGLFFFTEILKKGLLSIYQHFNSTQLQCTQTFHPKKQKRKLFYKSWLEYHDINRQKILSALSKSTAREGGKCHFSCVEEDEACTNDPEDSKKELIPSCFDPTGSRLSIYRHCNSTLPK